MKELDQLIQHRDAVPNPETIGLSDDVVRRFAATDADLRAAIAQAASLLADSPAAPESDLQADILNFYAPAALNPYTPLAARGPWIVTTSGAVLHDNGGYGMLGFGHAPADVLEALAQPYAMANVMTPSLSHKRFTQRLRSELGHSRSSGCPFTRFVCLNSGSEAVTMATRVSDTWAWSQVQPGGPKAGATPRFLSLKGSFHGRTGRPALASDSTRAVYDRHLASFARGPKPITVDVNDVEALHRAFDQAESDGDFIELMLMEPVMGEGNPGQAVERSFYDAARERTLAHGSLLLVDSIQAGLRACGALSIVDYPGFEDCDPPDMETWSKALNAGQYPLSVLGMTDRAAGVYVRGTYGNTMTTNPRALEVANAVLDRLGDALRQNVRDRGVELVEKLDALRNEFPDVITRVQGTGLLVSAWIAPDKIDVEGVGGLESWCRSHGLGVIHGGTNALRFTPHFNLASAEIDLIVDVVRQGIRAFLPVAQAQRQTVSVGATTTGSAD